MLHALLDLLVPPVCVGCGAPGRELCAACRAGLVFLRGPRCPRCGLPVPCGPVCPAAAQAFEASWTPVAYAGTAPALVHALKDRARVGLARVMAAQIAANAPPWLAGAPPGPSAPRGLSAAPPPARVPVLVPVPVHPSHRRARGFDQGERLARALGARTGLRVDTCLRRTGPASRQAGASRRQRVLPERLRIGCRPGEAPRVAILVDDVHTTGATLDAAARALRQAGAVEVRALAWARTL